MGSSDYGHRVTKALVLAILVILIALVFILDTVILRVIKRMWHILTCKRGDELEEHELIAKAGVSYFSKVYDSLQSVGLCSYDLRRNTKYRDIVRAMDIGEVNNCLLYTSPSPRDS
eukprot:TRINITY_DN12342_c0_g1_i3.p1 TRINITY_DN12342_c0_g1~~TRINITY_DN12342_c0_g1_i3.p1  ORF type:complete len:116 (-),score=18.76 TRINITY_DN12342_c0_g1_i3:38-385(-)